MAKSISILGCGWYGFAMAKRLIADGYMVKGSTTSQSKLSSLADYGIVPFLINFDGNGAMYDRSFFDSEVLIIALPPKRSSGEHREYPEKLRKIADAAQKGKVKFVLMISSTSVYAM